MDKTIEDDRSAFPCPETEYRQGDPGMTLREWYAGEALSGLIQVCQGDTIEEGKTYAQHVAGLAFAIADAMIAARKGET